MSVNDLLTTGGRPLFFLDYLGTGKLAPRVAKDVIKGVVAGCKEAGCALIGGEIAELPSLYQAGEYDLVGTIVGTVERQKILTGDTIQPGDRILGLASMGLHTNGYSLARKIVFEVCGYSAEDLIDELGITVADELLKPHRSYVKPILKLMEKYNVEDQAVKGLAHITGGGLLDNIPRILPENCDAVLEKGSWKMLPIFPFLQKKGNVAMDEMYRVFNMGIGMVLVASAHHADAIASKLESAGETVYFMGEIAEGGRKVILH